MKPCCWHCGEALPNFTFGKVGFRETCEKCGYDLHVCKGCQYFSPGKPNDCSVPGTEFVADREKRNLCEDFKLSGKPPQKGPSKEEIEKRLFGE
ncbi:MAG: hypothetical protein KDK62_01420 [Chlamydiia bacterium]|nr:hypothetical protein [Chlamydiia bacterium]